jgi:amino acid transporter
MADNGFADPRVVLPGLQIQGMIILNDPSYIPKPWHATLLTIAVVFAGCIFNTFFARRLPLIEAAMAIVHIVGFFAIMITLWVVSPKAPSNEVWTDLQNNAGWPTTGLAFMVGITSPVNALIGPDAAVHMCKYQDDQPSRNY